MPEGGCRTENLTAGGIQFQQSETLKCCIFWGKWIRAELQLARDSGGNTRDSGVNGCNDFFENTKIFFWLKWVRAEFGAFGGIFRFGQISCLNAFRLKLLTARRSRYAQLKTKKPWNPEEHQLGEQANSDPVCPVCFALRPRLFQSKVFATCGYRVILKTAAGSKHHKHPRFPEHRCTFLPQKSQLAAFEA